MKANAIGITTIGTSVFLSGSIGYFLRQVTRTDQNARCNYSIYGSFVDVREDSALILVLEILIDPEERGES